MSISLKEDILNAVRDSKNARTYRAKTPKFREPTAPPQYEAPPMPPVKPPKPPTSGSNAVKSSNVQKSCPYSTPCGWCTKWDKKCDKKPYNYEPNVKTSPIGDSGLILTLNKPCKDDADHEWVDSSISTEGYACICKKCGAYKTMPFIDCLTSPSVVSEIIDEVIKENNHDRRI